MSGRIAFWDNDTNRNALRRVMAGVTAARGETQKLVRTVFANFEIEGIGEEELVNTYKNFAKGAFGQNPHKNELLTPALLEIRKLCLSDKGLSELYGDAIENLWLLWEGGNTAVADKAPVRRSMNSQFGGATAISMSADVSRIGLEVVAAGMHIPPNLFEIQTTRMMKGEFVDETKSWRRRYYCAYRYHTVPNRIVKSHLIVIEDLEKSPGVCTFVNRACYQSERQEIRLSTGLVVPMYNATYLVGQAGDGAGMALVALPTLASDEPITGIFTTLDRNFTGQVAGRIVLVPTKDDHHEKVGIGVIGADDIPKADRAAVLEAIRYTQAVNAAMSWKG